MGPVAIMHQLEIEYMDPAITESMFKWEDEEVKVTFKEDRVRTQAGSQFFINRLYHENECPQPWTWYWLENSAKNFRCSFSAFPDMLERVYPVEKDTQRRKPYAAVGDDNLSSDITSLDIESAYAADSNGIKHI